MAWPGSARARSQCFRPGAAISNASAVWKARSPENYPIWGPDRATITPQNVGKKLHLRVELQTLFRLPRSNAILFGIRAYLASLEELARVPKWGRRLHRVLRDLHPELAGYKGLIRYREAAIDYLARI